MKSGASANLHDTIMVRFAVRLGCDVDAFLVTRHRVTPQAFPASM
jgi:hypothetical protein